MIELVNAEQLSGAIERARKSDLFVRRTTFSRQYVVTNRGNGHAYYVDFFVRNGKRFGHCTCKAGQTHRACKHLVAAAALHIGLSTVRRAQRQSR